jgi:hypothetical protein
VSVVSRGVGLRLHTLRCVLLETLDTEPLERSKSPSTRLNSVGRSDQVGGRVGDIGRRVRVLQCLFARVHWPSSNVNLLAERHVERLEERVHVLPAVQLAEAAELGGDDRLECVTGAVTIDELLDVSGLDLAAVVDDLSRGVDESLSEVAGRVVDLRETEGDVTRSR